jgi:hypothetical protein
MANIPCIDDNESVSGVRVLVVEDFEPYRRFICSKLGRNPDLQVVGEVSDGLGSGSQSRRLATELDFVGCRIANPVWNRSGSMKPHTLSRIQNNFRESGMLCRCRARSDWLRCTGATL